MPVNTPHPLYTARQAEWERCRDAYNGEDAVKARGTRYLPKLSEQRADEYASYVSRAMYFEAVGRTIDGFVGAIARKPAEIEAPPKLAPLIADASADGISLAELIKRLAIETILQGRSGTLVDFDDSKKRAYLAIYTTESIINWSDNQVILHETVHEPDPSDPFNQLAIEQYRQLHVVDGKYTVTIWRKSRGANDTDSEWVAGVPVTPKNLGKPLTEIPFYWLTPLGKTNRIERPPLLGLVNIALSHYRNSADLEHGRHFTGLPTPVISGVTNDEPIRIGSTSAILLPQDATATYLEFTGQGLSSLERALEHKESQMAALGAAVFQAAQRKGVEAAETARIRVSGENSLLVGVVDAIEETIEAALKCAANWMGIADGAIEVDLNRDFIEHTIEPQALQAFVAAFQAGAMTLENFLYILKRYDELPPETDIPTEAAKTAAEASGRAKEAADLAARAKPPKTKKSKTTA